jgi:hypothetical protein
MSPEGSYLNSPGFTRGKIHKTITAPDGAELPYYVLFAKSSPPPELNELVVDHYPRMGPGLFQFEPSGLWWMVNFAAFVIPGWDQGYSSSSPPGSGGWWNMLHLFIPGWDRGYSSSSPPGSGGW